NAAAGQRGGFDVQSDAEIHFTGAVTLDNGIKIRTRIELEGNSNVAAGSSNGTNGAAAAGNFDDIDENWIRISGAFGEVRLGSGDAAAQAMTTGYLGSWATNVGINQAFETSDWVTRPTSLAGSFVNRIDASSDAEHISYFTPRYAGFQAGLSYVPSRREDVNNQRELTAGQDSEGWSFGLNFDRPIRGVGVGIAAGYAYMNESTAGAINDSIVRGIAGRLDFRQFRVAVSWVDKVNQTATLGPFAGAGSEALEVGLRYTFGANAVSISHIRVQSDSRNATANDDKLMSTFLAYRRLLGTGVSWKIAAMFVDYEDGTPNVAGASSNDGHAVVTSILIRF
ncbi:unnamed protein product, partial [Discosporangium mesarthrocarpum]